MCIDGASPQLCNVLKKTEGTGEMAVVVVYVMSVIYVLQLESKVKVWNGCYKHEN